MSIVIPTSQEQLEHVATAVMTGIHDIFPANIVDGNDPISEKKMLKRGGAILAGQNATGIWFWWKAQNNVAWGRKMGIAPHDPTQLALSQEPQLRGPVCWIWISGSKVAACFHHPLWGLRPPLIVQPSPKAMPAGGLFPSKWTPLLGNIQLLDNSVGIRKLSDTLPQTGHGLAGYCWGHWCLKPRCGRHHHRQTFGVPPNGVLATMAPGHHSQCKIRVKPNGYDHKLGPIACRPHHPVAYDGACLWLTRWEESCSLQQQ